MKLAVARTLARPDSKFVRDGGNRPRRMFVMSKFPLVTDCSINTDDQVDRHNHAELTWPHADNELDGMDAFHELPGRTFAMSDLPLVTDYFTGTDDQEEHCDDAELALHDTDNKLDGMDAFHEFPGRMFAISDLPLVSDYSNDTDHEGEHHDNAELTFHDMGSVKPSLAAHGLTIASERPLVHGQFPAVMNFSIDSENSLGQHPDAGYAGDDEEESCEAGVKFFRIASHQVQTKDSRTLTPHFQEWSIR
jgi:hypothetical protein